MFDDPIAILVAELDGTTPAEIVVMFSKPTDYDEVGMEGPETTSELWILHGRDAGYEVIDHVDQEADDRQRWTGQAYLSVRAEALEAPCRQALWFSFVGGSDHSHREGVDLWRWDGGRLRPEIGFVTELIEYDPDTEAEVSQRRATIALGERFPRSITVSVVTTRAGSPGRQEHVEAFRWEGGRLVESR